MNNTYEESIDAIDSIKPVLKAKCMDHLRVFLSKLLIDEFYNIPRGNMKNAMTEDEKRQQSMIEYALIAVNLKYITTNPNAYK